MYRWKKLWNWSRRPKANVGLRERRLCRPGLEWLENRLAPASSSPFAGAQLLAAGTPMPGDFADASQVHIYRLEQGTSGVLTASVTPNNAGGFVPRLLLYGSAQQLLIQSDASASTSAPAQLSQFVDKGTYYLEVAAVTATPNSVAEGYVLNTAFAPAQPPFHYLPVEFQPKAVAVGSFRPGGNLDLVTANSGQGSVSVLLGNGDGTFANGVRYQVGSVPDSVAVADLDHDGNPDIITANYNGSFSIIDGTVAFKPTISVLLGKGDGTFKDQVTYVVGNGPRSVAVATLGTATYVATADYNDNTVTLLHFAANGALIDTKSRHVGNGPDSVALADVNGTLEIVASNAKDDTVSVLFLGKDGSLVPLCDPLEVPGSPEAVAVTVVNSSLEIAAANADRANVNNLVSVFLVGGDGRVSFTADYAVGVDPHAIAFEDFNHDRLLDIVTANDDDSASVLLGTGVGRFAAANTFAIGSIPYGIAVGSFTQSGNLDFATANDGDATVSIARGRGDGSFVTAPAYSVGTVPFGLKSGDLNHDGNLDAVSVNVASATVSVALGLGDGNFAPAVSYAVDRNPYAVFLADLNNDGTLDIVTANRDSGTLSLLFGRGDGTFLPARSINAGGHPFSIAVGNFREAADIVTANFDDNSVSLLRGNGDGTFQDPLVMPLPTVKGLQVGPQSVALGYFSNDGNLDIATVNSAYDNRLGPEGPGSVSILLGDGQGSFKQLAPIAVGQGAGSLAAGMAGDGKPVIVTTNFEDDTISVIRGGGDGTFSAAVDYPVGLNPGDESTQEGPSNVTLGALTGDGNLAIVTANSGFYPGYTFFGDGSVSVLLWDSATGSFAPAVTLRGGVGPESVQVGDFNNDGHGDIVAANAGDNTLSVFLGASDGTFRLTSPQNDMAIRNVPHLQDLTGDGIADTLVLSSRGEILFRRGQETLNQFAPPTIINQFLQADNSTKLEPARDVTVFQTAAGWAVAAADYAGNTVSIYSWDAATQAFRRHIGFATDTLPVRLSATDLTGAGRLGDLVVTNALGNSVTIAIQQADGTFVTETRSVGTGPASIAFTNVGSEHGPDIVVSDQVAGDFTELFNDSTHSFTRQARYRAGNGLFGISTQAGSNEQSILSDLRTVDVVAGRFTGANTDDLILLNQNARSFTLLPGQDQGSFANPQAANTWFPTGARASQLRSITFPGDELPSLAILMEDLQQIWIYHNNGDGTFAAPLKIDAGNAPRGFTVAMVKGRLALLVGNAYGDILTMLYQGHWRPPGLVGPIQDPAAFVPDRADLQNVPLTVTDANGDVVLANQATDQVFFCRRLDGTNQFAEPVEIDNASHLLAPGAVQSFTVEAGTATATYLAVANSLSNNVLVYQELSDDKFGAPTSYPVGDNPVAITVADVNGDSVPDLLVANHGSNDVSVLIGTLSNASWNATSYQRLRSQGSGPMAVAVRSAPGSAHGPDLLVTNSDGNVATLPGIGSAGQGTGFFQDTSAGVRFNQVIVQALPTPNGELVVSGNGGIFAFDGSGFTLVDFGVPAVARIALEGDSLVAAFADGGIGLLGHDANGNFGLLSEDAAFHDEVSALQMLQGDVYVTRKGSDVPLILAGADFIAIATELPPQQVVAQTISLARAELAVVAILLTGPSNDAAPIDQGGGTASDVAFAAFNPAILLQFRLQGGAAAEGGADEVLVPVVLAAGNVNQQAAWAEFRAGVEEAFQKQEWLQRGEHLSEDALQTLRGLFEQIQDWWRTEQIRRLGTRPGSAQRGDGGIPPPAPRTGWHRDHNAPADNDDQMRHNLAEHKTRVRPAAESDSVLDARILAVLFGIAGRQVVGPAIPRTKRFSAGPRRSCFTDRRPRGMGELFLGAQ